VAFLGTIEPLVPLSTYTTGNNKKSNVFKISKMRNDYSQVYVYLKDKGAGGVLNVRLQDSWTDDGTLFTNNGDQALAISADGISRITLTNTKGLYLRVDYDVQNNSMELGIFLVRREDIPGRR